MKILKLFTISLSIILFMNGCVSHKIFIDPELYKIKITNIDKKIDVNVGYYISNYKRNLEVITPGGGGDNVIYTPYRDTEKALAIMLSKIFKKVYPINSLKNKEKLLIHNIKYIFIPTIKTNTSSDSYGDWPPTKFTIEFKCEAINIDGKRIWEESVYSEGFATSDEFISDYYFSLAAHRATKKAFENMFTKLQQAKKFN